MAIWANRSLVISVCMVVVCGIGLFEGIDGDVATARLVEGCKAFSLLPIHDDGSKDGAVGSIPLGIEHNESDARVVFLHPLDLCDAAGVHPSLHFVVFDAAAFESHAEVWQIGATTTLDGLKPESFWLMLPFGNLALLLEEL